MLSRVYSVTVEGIEGILCEVEVDVSRGGFERPVIVGLPDTAVKESIERVRSAIINSGFRWPDTQSLVNLAPADVKKVGPAFDLPIALGILACGGALQPETLRGYVVIGELALDGRVRPVNGVLSMAMTAAAAGFTKMIVPLDNAQEAAVVKGIEVYPVGSLAQTAALLTAQLPMEPTTVDLEMLFHECGAYEVDFSDVKGQESVKRALTIAAAGGHNLIMIGPPGAGKTMLAQRMATILPPMTLPESLETTRIYSSVGLLPKDKALIATRPVRAPHHTASGPSLVGGGTHPRPGELSLAHHGILFLDEFAEFPRHVLEMIRQPLEEGQVTVSRAKGTLRFPARFILIAAMNPCPCGYFSTGMRRCRCTPTQIERYMAKISGPLMDRMDIHIDVPLVEFRKLRSRQNGDSSEQIRSRVQQARRIQRQRFGHPFMTNAMMGHKQVEKFCELDSTSEMLLRQAMAEFALSARAHDKICKVARTIADLEGSESIQPAHIAEAVGYRKLDRKL
ncbi:MAG TPA: YifB family Mg chelatase-like AAA ATPase [Anaerohalosphaeraceae bacterium]|nr:YifB family Mg chelatase-like AAA ATPase [Anaerohalosphaeraceae bacterium]HPB93075.1 YifB family Mg chelatase-like AAA ATPase [Anaerohalosphaeraceae bacterium]HRT23364.1 YifB family Mg chelatase-like AAA ATPase [Anaerohalosphaeraceae bacterium]HRU14992.1 YifB family Mg chelatase-like AAA ATPase [Anaerohalosphaeraceae bacterium]